MTANQRMPMLHNEGLTTRNYTSYNFQVLRDDGFMLAIDGTVTGHRVAPARSSCAIVVSSQNQNREWLYYMQQTVSAEGLAGTAFSTFVPHTVRSKETKSCDDCHISQRNDNNAWMAQLLVQVAHVALDLEALDVPALGREELDRDGVREAEHVAGGPGRVPDLREEGAPRRRMARTLHGLEEHGDLGRLAARAARGERAAASFAAGRETGRVGHRSSPS